VLDNVGNHPASAWRRVLRPEGTYLASFGHKHHRAFGPAGHLMRTAARNLVVSQRLTLLTTAWNSEELETLTGLIESGQVTPVIDRTYPLAAVVEAMDHLAEGHARGKVVITI
jgi:NADPH:quinone reductase-like Zn-dependent oxidoreductase